MNKLIIIIGLLLTSNLANAEWVLNNSIGNDPDKEKLCISRLTIKGPIVPFEIDSDYVARMRALYPDITFVVAGEYLVECRLREGTGRYEPDAYQGLHWRLIKPKQFEPNIKTREGENIAFNICRDAYLSKSNRPNYSHSVILSIQEGIFTEVGVPNYAKKNKGIDEPVDGKKVERYDVVVQGTAYYKPANPDLTAINFTCLLSPMFEVKAIQFKIRKKID